MNTPDWQTKDVELIREVLRLGEAKLAAQVQVATSSDQRAAVLAGIYAATATGIIVALGSNADLRALVPVLAGTLAAGIALLAAGVLCILATLPTDFLTPGNDPHEWYDAIHSNTPLKVAMGEQAAYYDENISENDEVLARNSNLFFYGAILGIAAPVIGIVVAGILCLFGM